MTRHRYGSSSSPATVSSSKFCVFSFWSAGSFLLCFTGVLELTWPQQLVLGILTMPGRIWMDRSSSSYLVTLTLMLVSMFSTFRYGYLAYRDDHQILPRPRLRHGAAGRLLHCLLLFAEAYAFVILFLGYLQTLWPLRRTPVSSARGS